MFSRITLCVLALFYSIAAQAVYESNWLFGVGAGNVSRQGTVNIDAGGPEDAIGSVHLRQTGLIWGVTSGYQGRCDGWLLGGELHVDWDRGLQENDAFMMDPPSTFNVAVKLHRKIAVGFSTRLGYELGPDLFDYTPFFLPYVRLGFESSKDHLNLFLTDQQTQVYVDSEGSRRDWRFILGAGLEVPVIYIMGLSVRLEYDYMPKGRVIENYALASDQTSLVVSNTNSHTHAIRGYLVWNFV
jgi:hypothetical protein